MLRSWSVSLTGLISATSSPSSKHATFGRCLGSNWHRDTNTQREIIGRTLLTTRERVAPFLIVACRTFNTPQPIGKNQIAIRGLAVPRATRQRTTGRAKSRAFTMGARSGLIHLQKDCTPPSIAMSQPCAERRCVMVQILLAYRDQFPQSAAAAADVTGRVEECLGRERGIQHHNVGPGLAFRALVAAASTSA